MTDCCAGIGGKWACAFVRGRRVPGATDVNAALRHLGVGARDGADEFDTLGLGRHRHPPEALERYVDLCDELGV